jgi:mono/diheme cytochrome c family protein
MPSKRARTALLLGLAFLVPMIGGANAQTSTEGKVLAQSMCAECHAIQSAQLQSPNPYAPPFETIANVRGMSSPALWSILHSSHRRMPNIILRPEQTRAIVAYILTLQDTP